jgi:multiple sugar transport system permease protein
MYDFKLKKAAFTFILAVLMIPAQVSVVGFIAFLMQVNLMDTYVPLIIPSIASPAVVFFMHQYMKVALPVDLVQAARIEGCGEFRIFNSIAIPIMVPAMATQAIFSFVFSWNNLFMPTMIINSQEKFTIPMMVQILKSDRYRTDFGTVYLGITLTILPMMVIYAFLSKYIIQGIALGGVKY